MRYLLIILSLFSFLLSETNNYKDVVYLKENIVLYHPNQLLIKFKNNINIIKGNSNLVLKQLNTTQFDYVFLDGGHKYETVRNDLEYLKNVVKNKGTILCDDYNLSYAPGVKKSIDEYVTKYNFNLKIYNERFAEITFKST